MVREKGGKIGVPDDTGSPLPEGTHRVLVAGPKQKGINFPVEKLEGYEPADPNTEQVTLGLGDALPMGSARDCYNSFPDRCLVIDEDDEVLAKPDECPDERVRHIIELWNEDGFDPNADSE